MRYTISSALAIAAFAAAAQAEVPKVVTDIPPVGALVAQVMGDLGQPEVLLTGGASPHDFQLRPSQARALNAADLVVWVGPELTPWLERALEGADHGAQLGLLNAPGTYHRIYPEGGDGDDHDSDDHDGDAAHSAAGHADHDQHAHADQDLHDHAHSDGDEDEEGHHHHHHGVDPHAWLDPGNAQAWLRVIAAELSRLDPEHADTYAANATSAVARIGKMNDRIAERLAPVRGEAFVTFHDAYGYLSEHYGLKPLGAISAGDAHSPGAARLAALRDTIGHADICLFPEVQHNAALIRQMADASGARVGKPLDPEGTAIAPGPDAYDALMTGLADTLVSCLSH